MKPHLILRGTLVALATVTFCSCASVSVREETADRGKKPTGPPKRIYVVPFEVAKTEVGEGAMRQKKGQLKFEGQQLIAKYLVEEMSKNIAPTSVVKSAQAAGKDGWVITGDLTRISEGSRLFRMAIGLGLGGTKMETDVAVRNAPANAPFLTFRTSGGSNATPGAATNPIPFSAAPTAIFQSTKGVTDDAARTARMITATVADYMVKRGWMAPGKVTPPKRAK
ncbi:MAG: DUF4410 domain-containing protein [Chthoniobacteraceae bacterium]